MCGRFALSENGEAQLHSLAAALSNDLPALPNYNICPTDQVCSVISVDGVRRMTPMRWGFIPHWYRSTTSGPLLINARAESLAVKPAFRAACRERRCLIPASGFYEWTKGEDGKRLPWYAAPPDGRLIAFAGLWQAWSNTEGTINTLAIVTTEANADLAAIHHRAPLVIEPSDHALWLGEAGHGAARLMRPAPAGSLVPHRVDPRINSNRAVGADLIAPID